MKKINSLALLLCISLFVSAQTDTLFKDKTFRFQGQLGFNATSFLKQFIVLNNQNLTQVSPYDVNGKFLVGVKYVPSLLIGPRVGLGYSNTHTYSNNDQQTNERSTDISSRAFRVGLELQHILSKRWIIYYGVDYINHTGSTSSITTTSFTSGFPPVTNTTKTEIATTSKSTGGGPIIGIQFNIGRWVCLGTETSFYYIQSTSGSKTTSSNPNNTVPETFADSRTTQFVLPFFINCNVVF
ncbi:MAG: hypothetical protein V4590_14200 [Bacteroidota bacterium]